MGWKSGTLIVMYFQFFFFIGDEFGEPIIAERMIRIADNPMSKGTNGSHAGYCIHHLESLLITAIIVRLGMRMTK